MFVYVELITNVSERDLPRRPRKWVGNDATKRHHHGSVSLEETQMYLWLLWKRDANATPRTVGLFSLDLAGLLKAKYIRRDKPGHVRVRFVHADDGGIYLQVRPDAPRLRVASMM